MLKEPVERLIGQYLVDMVDEAGYLPATDLGAIAAKLGAPQTGGREGSHGSADARPARRVRAFAGRVPGAAAQGAEPLRPDHQPLSREPASAGRAQLSRRCARRSACEMDELLEIIAEIKKLNPKPGLKFGSVQVQPVVPDVLVRAAPGRHMDHRAQHRHAAARAGQPHLPRRPSRSRPARRPTATTCSNACRPPTGW